MFSTSSVLLVVLFVALVGSMRRIERKRRPDVVRAQVLARDVLEQTDPVFPRDSVLLRPRTDMTGTDSAPGLRQTAPADHPRPAGSRAARPAGIRRGRAAIALAGLLALGLGILTAVLAPFTALAWPLPVFLLLVGVGCLAGLRYLAVAERSAARRPASASHTSAPAPTATDADDARTAAVFDNQPASGARAEAEALRHRDPVLDVAALQAGEVGPDGATTILPVLAVEEDEADELDRMAESDAPAPSAMGDQGTPSHLAGAAAARAESATAPRLELTIEELREQARRVAQNKPVAFTPVSSSWEPVGVPRPTYLDAPAAARPAPAPLPVPQEVRAQGSTVAESARLGRGEPEVLDLDDVLSRRRA